MPGKKKKQYSILGEIGTTESEKEAIEYHEKRGSRCSPLSHLSTMPLVSGPPSEFPNKWASVSRFRQFPQGAAHHDLRDPRAMSIPPGLIKPHKHGREKFHSYCITKMRRNQYPFLIGYCYSMNEVGCSGYSVIFASGYEKLFAAPILESIRGKRLCFALRMIQS